VPPHQTPYHLIKNAHETILRPPRREHDGDAVYALLGLAVLMMALFLATGVWD